MIELPFVSAAMDTNSGGGVPTKPPVHWRKWFFNPRATDEKDGRQPVRQPLRAQCDVRADCRLDHLLEAGEARHQCFQALQPISGRWRHWPADAAERQALQCLRDASAGFAIAAFDALLELFCVFCELEDIDC